MIHIDKWFTTAGNGYWSKKQKQVHCFGLELAYINDERDFGELRVHFSPTTWNVNVDGLIYTDTGFMNQLRNMLYNMGLTGHSVSYSEQGMQGDTYVSCDVGEFFIDDLASKYPEEFIGMLK